jgi:hypothetical protein
MTHQELKERHHPYHGEEMCNRRHDRPEFGTARIQHRPQEQRDEEQDQQYSGIPYDRAQGNDADADERAGGLYAALWERLDK